MSIDNLPENSEEITNIAAKSGYLKVKTELGEIKLNSNDQIEVQPKGTPFGAKVKIEDDGSITHALTFDTKKLRDQKKNIDTSKMLDDAINDFWKQT
jgi:homogentisate 1,2-dioxygenase